MLRNFFEIQSIWFKNWFLVHSSVIIWKLWIWLLINSCSMLYKSQIWRWISYSFLLWQLSKCPSSSVFSKWFWSIFLFTFTQRNLSSLSIWLFDVLIWSLIILSSPSVLERRVLFSVHSLLFHWRILFSSHSFGGLRVCWRTMVRNMEVWANGFIIISLFVRFDIFIHLGWVCLWIGFDWAREIWPRRSRF